MADLNHLRPATLAWYQDVLTSYVLEPHHIRLLQLACEAFDQSQTCREILAKEGLFVRTKSGIPRTHPAVGVQRDCRIMFARLIKDLALDSEPDPVRVAAAKQAARRRGDAHRLI